MATDELELELFLPAVTPEAIYRAWLLGDEHARMTGAAATGRPTVGASFTAWDGYISGKNLELRPARRILQSWRSTQFPAKAPDSLLELQLFEKGDGTRLVLIHSAIPAGQGASYQQGWVDHYFEPMQRYFAKKKRPRPARKAAAKSSARKAGTTRKAGARKSVKARKKR